MSTWWGPLIQAIGNHDIDTVKRLILEHELSYSIEWPFDRENFSACDLLCEVISRGDREIAEELLACGIPVNGRSKRGLPTPLHEAVIQQNIEITDVLLQRNANVFAEHDRKNPLEYAVEKQNVEIAERLLTRVAHINSPDNNGMTQVYEWDHIFGACSKGSAELLELLLSRSSEIPISGAKKSELLIRATELRRTDLIEVVMKYGGDINAAVRGKTALQTAVKGGHFKTVDWILKYRPDIDVNGNTRILCLALEDQKIEDRYAILDALMSYGFGIRPEDANDGSLLKAAITGGHLNVVEALLDYGADVRASCKCLEGSTFLHVAVDNRHLEIVKILLDRGADVNMKHKNDTKPPIYSAVNNLDLAMTRLFLFRGAFIEDMYDLLILAVQIDGIEMVKFLLQDTKFDINSTRGEGVPVLLNLIYAFIFRKVPNSQVLFRIQRNDYEEADLQIAEMAELCIRRGATVDAKNFNGKTAVFAAVELGLGNLVEKLLEYGANVDSRYNGNTLLMNAVDLNTVQRILNYLPDCKLTDYHGRTVYDIAARYASPSIIQELLDYGAVSATKYTGDISSYKGISCSHDTEDVLIQHEHKMKALKSDVNSNDSEEIQEDFYIECKREIKEMKGRNIGGSGVSFRDILIKGNEQLAMYVQNDKIAGALSMKDDYAKTFPIYSGMVYRRFLRAFKLKPLLTASERSFDCLIGFELPYFIRLKVLCYLSIEDLKNLMKASPATGELPMSE